MIFSVSLTVEDIKNAGKKKIRLKTYNLIFFLYSTCTCIVKCLNF